MKRVTAAVALGFDESQHERDERGRFASGGGGGDSNLGEQSLVVVADALPAMKFKDEADGSVTTKISRKEFARAMKDEGWDKTRSSVFRDRRGRETIRETWTSRDLVAEVTHYIGGRIDDTGAPNGQANIRLTRRTGEKKVSQTFEMPMMREQDVASIRKDLDKVAKRDSSVSYEIKGNKISISGSPKAHSTLSRVTEAHELLSIDESKQSLVENAEKRSTERS